MSFDHELDRARDVFTRTDESGRTDALYQPFRPAVLFTVQERDWLTAQLLREAGLSSLSGLDILDVGCGKGGELRRMTTFGAEPERLAGIDLSPSRAEAARRALPGARIETGSAHQLPFEAGSFDLVSQFVVFSSVADPRLRKRIAAEMSRVVRPGGLVLWYDMHRLRPTPDLVPIKLDELRELFPGFTMKVRSTTLRWKLNQRLVWRSRGAALLLERMPLLCSHYLAVLRAPKREG